MKKFLSILLACVLVLSAAACSGGNDSSKADSSKADSSKADSSAPADSSTADSSTAEESSAAEEESSTVEANIDPTGDSNALIVGNISALSGDFNGIWTNNGGDATVRRLLEGYSPATTDQGGEYLWDPTVVASHEETLNEDGSKTFQVTINEGLTYNNGDPITAKDYCAYVMFFSSPLVKDSGKGTTGQSMVGWAEFNNGEAKEFSGVRLIDEYTFSFQIASDKIPYYYELSYMDVQPLPLQMWTVEGVDIADDGNGCYFTGSFGTDDASKAKMEEARYLSNGRITAGPYQLKSYDESSKTATLTINPNYAGNFEGQKPSIETIIFTLAESATQMDKLATGGLDMIMQLSEGKEITAALDLVDAGGYNYTVYERAGYGHVMFQCDFGPTQFVAVRQAVAYLLDRNEFAKTFTGGFGGVVNGPYSNAMWQYEEAGDTLESTLNPYSFSPDEAIALLEEDGWVYNADGSDYSGTGIRYKKVTAEEAGDYKHNVTLSDGTILMPLIIEWAASTGNPVSELLSSMLAQGADTAAAGMQINQNSMEFNELLNYMYRDASQGDKYAVKTYGMYNLASDLSDPRYDYSYNWSSDPTYVDAGLNTNFLFDDGEGGLDDLSMKMVYTATTSEEFLDYWVRYIQRWNELLPELPLYSNEYHDVFADKLENYEPTSLWTFSNAILYANIKGY